MGSAVFLRLLARAASFLVAAALAAATAWWMTSNHYQRQISNLEKEQAQERQRLSDEKADAEKRARDAEREMQQRVATVDQKYAEELENARKTASNLRGRIDDQSLRLRVLAKRPKSCGGGAKAADAGSVVDDTIEIQLPDPIARRVLAIGEEADRAAVKLKACQAYVRSITGYSSSGNGDWAGDPK